MKRKVIALLIAMVMVAGIATGCSNDSGTSSPEPSASASTPASPEASTPSTPSSPAAPATDEPTDMPTITAQAPAGGTDDMPSKAPTGTVRLITMDQMDQHWKNVDKGCQEAIAALEEMGGSIDYKWLAPDTKDDAKQIEMINTAISEKADVILLAANGPDAVTEALKEASAAGIKIVYVDSPANFEGEQTLATDNKAAGTTAGQQMLKAFESAGITEGDIGIVNVNTSTDSVVQREAGFKEAFEGTAFNILETQYMDGDTVKSKDAASTFVTQGVVGLFGCNEGSTVGVGNAIAESGNAKLIGVGFDKSDMIMGLIKDGHLLCTMSQSPDKMGYDGMITAGKLLVGDAISEKNVDTGVLVLDKGSVE